jgi:chromosome segregation ATPase
MSKRDIDELVRWRDKCEALAASLQRKVRHCDEITEERNQMERERDEALSRMEDLEADVRYYEDRWERIIGGAYLRGAEAMREACARKASVCANHRGEELDAILSALPIPEET